MSGLKGLIHEIHHRSLWQVLGIYIAGSWLAFEAVQTLTEGLGLPDWVPPLALALLIVGLPFVVATAFVQEGMSAREPQPAPPSRGAVGAVERSPTPEPTGHQRLFTWRNATVGGVLLFAVLGLVTAGYMAMRTLGIGPAGTLIARGVLDDRATILVTDFRSDDPSLARAVGEALRIDLSQSGVLRLAERDFVAAALARMGRAAGDPLDLALGRELAQREGLPAVLGGEVTRAGAGYLLSAELVDASNGATLVSHRETAADSAQILPAIDKLSRRIRERIGESLRSLRADPPLERVTTPSLQALRDYSLALEAFDVTGDKDLGLTLLEDALARDSLFAMAWRKLGIELSNAATARSRVIDAFRRAYENRDRLTARERYLAEAAYHNQVSFDLPAAIIAYERMLELDPNDGYALNNLGAMYAVAREPARAEEYYLRAAEANPASALSILNLASTRANLGRQREAMETLAAAEERFPDNPRVDLYYAHVASARGDYAEFEERYRRLLATGSQVWTDIALQGLADLAAARGRRRESEEIAARALDAYAAEGRGSDYLRTATRAALVSILHFDDPGRGLERIEAALARYPLDSLHPLERPYLDLAGAYAWAGRPDRARQLLSEFETALEPTLRLASREGDAGFHRTRGAVAMAEGRFDEAIEAYRRGDRGRCLLCATPLLAVAYDRAGEADSALVLYERFVTTPQSFRLGLHGFFAGPYGDRYFLAPSLERLGQLYDERGDLESAVKYYARFVELWAEADEELQPRVRAAQARLEEIVRARG